ncbi:hypothetical protein TrCOL_g5218 [Triparma columacea]|uniref:EF-hand domain-containing protein n=1 Tax=Triparma columacea TaxID=722753 RepID=A0A9W7L4T6_9STRA|nr:hypothetical protein TrCOL_g5218 [Triparma columacea]
MAGAVISDEEIERMLRFLDPNDDGVSKEEFVSGFQAARRLRRAAAVEIEGKSCLRVLVGALGDKSPLEWFCECNGEPDNDEALDIEELRAGLKGLGFRKKSVALLQEFLDPDMDGDVDVDTFKAMLDKVEDPSEFDKENLVAAESLERLEKNIEEEGVNLGELFNKVDKDAGGEIDAGEMKGFLAQLARPSKATLGRMKKAADKVGGVELKEDIEGGALDSDSIDLVMEFLDPNGDGITREELTAGFRQARRARDKALQETMGKRVFKAVLKKIGGSLEDLETWFNKINRSRTLPGCDPVVDYRELKWGVKAMKVKMTAANLSQLTKFLDPDGDGDICLPEFKKAVERLDEPSTVDAFAANAGGLIMQLQQHMKKNKIRMCDLFREIDEDNSGFIESPELRAGLENIIKAKGPMKNKKKKMKEIDKLPASPRLKLDEAIEVDRKLNVPPPVAAE